MISCATSLLNLKEKKKNQRQNTYDLKSQYARGPNHQLFHISLNIKIRSWRLAKNKHNWALYTIPVFHFTGEYQNTTPCFCPPGWIM